MVDAHFDAEAVHPRGPEHESIIVEIQLPNNGEGKLVRVVFNPFPDLNNALTLANKAPLVYPAHP